jgi:surfeit locus 1 family protein
MAVKNIITFLVLVAAVALMLRLGFWQLERLQWKEAILADIEAQHNADPMQNPLNLENATEFESGYIEGKFNDNLISIQPRTSKGKAGQHIYGIIVTEDGQNLAVNYGWLPAGETLRYADLYTGRFFGYLKKADKVSSFIPENDYKNNNWYSFNSNDFKRYFNLDHLNDKILYSTVSLPSSNIQPFEGLPQPRNKHAQYAIFWFFMAGLLVFLSGYYLYSARSKTP